MSQVTFDYPALIITRELTTLYSNLSSWGIIVNVIHDISECRAFIAKFRQVDTDIPISLSDVSILGRYQSIMLKFVEEVKLPFICISSQDNISRVLFSRFRSVIKYPVIVENQKDKPALLKPRLSEGDEVEVEELVKYAPSLYPIECVISQTNLPVRDKIRQLLFT